MGTQPRPLRALCFLGWPWVLLGLGSCFPPQACGLSVPISVTTVSGLSPLGGALTCGLSVLCVSLNPFLPWPLEFLALKGLHWAFLSLPSSSRPLRLLLAPPQRGGPLAVAVAAETQTGQPSLLL